MGRTWQNYNCDSKSKPKPPNAEKRHTSQFDELLDELPEPEDELMPFDEVDAPEDLAFIAHVLPQYRCIFEPSEYLGRKWQC